MRSLERGYALILVIVVIAVLSVGVLAAARTFSDVSASTARVRADATDVVAAETLMSRVTFLLLTRESDGRSVPVVQASTRWRGAGMSLDGAPYAIVEMQRAYVAVQDEAGLFSLNAPDQQALTALLAAGGVGRDAQALAASLIDYADEDDVARDGGAERREYARLGLTAPADAPLVSRWQALEALGWRASRVERTRVWPWFAAAPSEIALNINTAPEPVLEALLGDRRLARAIIVRRNASPIIDLAEAEALTAAAVRADGVTFGVAPGRVFRVQAVFGSQTPVHGIERRVELGGAEAARPFKWIEEREVRSAPWRDDNGINRLSLDAAAS